MFVYSVKTSKSKIAVLLIALIATAAAVLFLAFGEKTPVATNENTVSYKAENAEQRNAFISQFGWKFSSDPVEVSEVIIPQEFDDIYMNYNEINKAQGLDLEPYKGMRAKRWTYDILNYPAYEGRSGVVQLNLLVFNGVVIGGDVCSLENNGFIHGFDFPKEAPTTVNIAETTQKTSVSGE